MTLTSWVRMGFVALGVFAVVLAIYRAEFLTGMIANMPDELPGSKGLVWKMLASFLTPLVLSVVGVELIRRRHELTERFADIDQVNPSIPVWEQAVYRLGCTLVGLLLVSWSFPTAIQVTSSWFMAAADSGAPEGLQFAASRWAWAGIGYLMVCSVLGGYLIWGAPHFVNWQIHRIVRATSHSQSQNRSSS